MTRKKLINELKILTNYEDNLVLEIYDLFKEKIQKDWYALKDIDKIYMENLKIKIHVAKNKYNLTGTTYIF